MAERFCTTLDCVDVGFIPVGLLDGLPLLSQIDATRIGGIDLNKPQLRHALSGCSPWPPPPPASPPPSSPPRSTP